MFLSRAVFLFTMPSHACKNCTRTSNLSSGPDLMPPPPAPGPGAVCPRDLAYDYNGNDISQTSGGTAGDCCLKCIAEPKCKFFSFATDARVCYLKSSNAGRAPNPHMISGSKPPTPTPAPPGPGPPPPGPVPTPPGAACPRDSGYNYAAGSGIQKVTQISSQKRGQNPQKRAN